MNHKKSIVISNVQKNTRRTYVVAQGETFTLVLILKPTGTLEARISVRLVGEGAHANILGIVLGKDKTTSVLRTLQRHEGLQTTSNLLVKSVLTDSATFHYDGAIRVERAAQKADAYQRNENLLLSPHAHADSRPSLEILANDVRCTHGATVGRVDDEQLWYLASRGIRPESAKGLLIGGFLEGVLSRIHDTIARERVRQKLWKTLRLQQKYQTLPTAA